MSNELLCIIVLFVYTLIREVVFWYNTQKLLNKIMSRNYHEYTSAQEIYKPKDGVMMEQGYDQSEETDMAAIQEIASLR